MNSNSENRKVRKTYFWKNSSVDYIYFPNELYDDFLMEDGSFVDIPITALRIIFSIVFSIKNQQFRPEDRPKQLSLFENEFESENNVFVQLSIKNAEISPSQSSDQILKAYEFLVKYKMKWYKSLNSKDVEIKSYGGLISNPSYKQRGYTVFLISQYWFRKIIVMSEYNTVLYKLAYNLKNSKPVLFALWLNRIPDKNLPEKGLPILLSTFNKKINLNYSTAGDFCTKFLYQVKKNLDRTPWISFTYSFTKNKIYIKPKRSQKTKSENLIYDMQIVSNVKYRLVYFQRRFDILDTSFEKFTREYTLFPIHRKLIETSYKQFIKNCRKLKLSSTSFKDKFFLEEIQSIMINEYLKTPTGKKIPNGIPVIF